MSEEESSKGEGECSLFSLGGQGILSCGTASALVYHLLLLDSSADLSLHS